MSETPTLSVYEAAKIEIAECNREIFLLEQKRRAAWARLEDPKWKNWAEAERKANQAKPYQNTKLPQG